MTPAERTRLVRVLGMLGSDQDGERAAAGLLATRIVQSAGMNWDQLVQLQSHPCTRPPAPNFAPPSSDMGVCLRNLRQLTPWETDFVLRLRGHSFLSISQRRKLGEIASALRKRGAE